MHIVTDLIHLQLSPHKVIWYDAVMIISFALTGLLLFFYSLRDMKKILESHFKISIAKSMQIITLFLVSFGVYLGRFLRFNSWDIIRNPFVLFNNIIQILVSPFDHNNAWMFTFGFGIFLWLVYTILEKLTLFHQHNPEDI